MENDINRLSLEFKNVLMDQIEDYLNYIKDFEQVNGSLFCYNV